MLTWAALRYQPLPHLNVPTVHFFPTPDFIANVLGPPATFSRKILEAAPIHSCSLSPSASQILLPNLVAGV